MCNQCHDKLSDECVLSDLTETLKNPQFEKWNTTSLGHVLIAIEGQNGSKAHDIALQLAENFYSWFLGPTNGEWKKSYSYNPCLEAFPHSSKIREMIDSANVKYKK